MGTGDYQRHRQYFKTPQINKPLSEIYADLDAFTQEIFETDTDRFSTVSFYTLLPPLYYQGKFVKGFYLSESVDLLNKILPQLAPAFFAMAYSMWCSYPWSRTADVYCNLYDNPQRDAWFRQTYSDRNSKILIPLMDSDFTNEYLMAPKAITEKDIDILCVSRLSEEKNLDVIAQAIKIYHHKYQPLRLSLITGVNVNPNSPETLNAHSQTEWQKITNVLGNPSDYLNLIPPVNYHTEIPEYYSRAKVCVMGGLLEGKNRSLIEAISCNTPVVCFAAYNQYARGNSSIFPPGAGLTSEYHPEALADTLHLALANLDSFQPRRRYLEISGRKNFFNRCLDSLPYYRETIPDYVPGQAFNNLWLDLAIQQNYQMSLYDFVYGRSLFSHLRGIDQIYRTITNWIKLK